MKKHSYVALEALLHRIEQLEDRIAALSQAPEAVTATTDDPPYYTITEFCQRTGLSYSAVMMRCRRGTLRAKQEGFHGRWWIEAQELAHVKEGITQWQRRKLRADYVSL